MGNYSYMIDNIMVLYMGWIGAVQLGPSQPWEIEFSLSDDRNLN